MMTTMLTTTNDTRKASHRPLRFDSPAELLSEIDRILAAERAGTLRATGNWSAGTIFGHVAAWMNYPTTAFRRARSRRAY